MQMSYLANMPMADGVKTRADDTLSCTEQGRFGEDQLVARDSVAQPAARQQAPMTSRIPQGSSISCAVNPRQMEPSSARMLHFTGLALLSTRMKGGMNSSGIIAPPNMAISMFPPHAAPETASSVFPMTDISIMMPTKQNATHSDEITSRPGLRGRIPSQVPSAHIMPMTATTAMKQAIALPAMI